MQRFVAIIFIIFLSHLTLAQSPTWSATKEIAEQEDKKVLLVFSGSDWCRGCILFDQQVLQDPVFQDFASHNLALYKADFPRKNKNKPTPEVIKQNEKLIMQFNPRGAFPYVLLLDENEEVILKAEGNIDRDEFLASIRSATE